MKRPVRRYAPNAIDAQGARKRRKYQSGVRPLEDRVTLSASPGADPDPLSPDIDPTESTVSVVSATSAEAAIVTTSADASTAASAYSTVSAAWFTRLVEPDASTSNSAGTTEWIVRLTARALDSIHSVAEAADQLKVESLGLSVAMGLGLPGQLLLRATGASADVEAYLAGNHSLAYWEQNRDVAMQSTPNDPSFAQLYGLNNTGQTGGTPDADIDAPEAWNISTGSRSIVVAVIDTGIDYNHPDLAVNIWTNPGEIAGDGIDNDHNGFVDDVHGYDFAKNDGDPMDDRYHGTHVAGVIGAVGNNAAGVTGVNWSTSIMALKFMNASGTGSVSAAVQAINYATMMRTQYGVNVRVTNSSWSGGDFRKPLQDAIDAGGAADILFVTAAGNDAANVDTKPQYPTSFDSPYIVSVAATDHKDQLATFSNYGATHVDLAAPGVNVLSTAPGGTYLTLSGTSVSAPYVAGAAALALSVNPTLTALGLKAAILNSVDVLPSLSGLVASEGRLNVDRLLESLGMNVASVTPAAGSTVTTPPTSFLVRFGDAVDPSSVAAADFQVNGIAADSFTITTADTVTFLFNSSPVTTEGLQTMTMAAGAVKRAGDGGPLSAYSATFRFDALPLTVTASVPASSSTVTLPMATIDLKLNEAFDPASIGTDDLALTQGTVLSATAVDATTVRYAISGVTAEGVLGYTLAAGALRDAYGNGNVAYVGSLTLDYDVRALPPTELSGATHSLAYRTSADGTIGFTGDVDRLTLAIDAGQQLTVVVDGAGGLIATVELRDASDALVATATAAAAGGIAVLRNLPIDVAGTYTIVVRGAASTGAYSLTALLNSDVEMENYGGDSNGIIQTPQSIDGAFIALGNGGARAAVAGRLANSGDVDYYVMNVTAGESISAWLSAGDSSPIIRFIDASGTNLVQGTPNDAAHSREIVDFRAPASGVMYVLVSGAAGVDYQLLLGREVRFDRSGNTSLVKGEELPTASGRVLGSIESAIGMGRLFVYDATTARIRELDRTTGAVLRSFASPAAAAAGNDFGLATTGTTLLAAGSASSAIYELDPDTGAVIRTIGTSGTNISGLAYHDGEIFIRSDVNNLVTVRDYLTGAVLRTFTIAPSSEALAGAPDTLYASNGTTLLVLDPLTGTTRSTHNLSAVTGVIQGLGVIGDELYVGSGGNLYVFDRTMLALKRQATGLGDLEGIGADGGSSGVIDYYRLTLTAGATFHASTATPADGVGEFANRLDAKLLLYDVGGNLVASDDNSGADGRNADLSFAPTLDGTYYLAVVAADPADAATSHGEYVLEYSGAAAATETFRVSAIDPPNGSLVTGTSLRQFTVTFDDDVLLSSLSPTDFKIDGISTNQTVILDGKTILFILGGQVTSGSHTITLAAGSILNTHQVPLAAFTSTFTLDGASPKVVASSIQEGGVLSPGDLAYVVTFSEAMNTAAVDPTDFTLHGKLRNVDYAAANYSFDATGKILTIRYTALPEDAYTLTLVSGDGRFEDAAGNNLDGEPAFPMPPATSGDGAAGGDFAVNFSIDADTRALEPALAGVGVPGAAAYQTATGHEVAISTPGDVDEITVTLDAGQTLTALVTSSRELRVGLEVYGPGNVLLGSFAGTSAGRVLIAQTLPVAAAGTYRLRISGAGGTTGTASVFVTLNALVEGEQAGSLDNNSIATAQSIDTALVAVGGTAARGAVIGSVDVATASTLTLAAAYTGSWTDGGGHQADNANYVVGINSGTRRNFFVFDLSSIAWSIVGAQLQIENPTGGFVSSDGSETYSLFDVATPISTLTSTADGLTSVFDDLGSGTTLGSLAATSASDGQVVSATLNSAAVALLNQGRGGEFAVGGAITTLAGASQQSLFGFTGSTNLRQLVLTLGAPSPDYYSFRLSAGETVSVGLKNLAGSGAVVTLYDAAGNALATSTAATGSLDRVIAGFTAPTGGTYYLGVTSATQSTYEVVVTKNAVFDNGANESRAAAQSLVGAAGLVSSATAVGYATAAGDDYAFTLSAAGTLQLSTATPGDGSGAYVNTLNPTIELYDSGGTLLAANADGGIDGRNALLTYGAAAGSYVVRVVAAAGQGEYLLTADRTPSTAPVISAISDVSIAEDGMASVTFSVSDPDTPAASLAVTASAADAGLLPAAGMNLVNLGSGNWRLDLTPAPNRFGVTTVTVRASDGTTIAGRSFLFTAKGVNDAPTFAPGANLTFNRLSGAQTLVNWASGISAGPFEAAQGLEFLVANDNPSLFTVAPTISADGTLRFTPSGTVGKATITVRLHDTGGTSDGGVDTSDPITFTITIDNNTPTLARLDPTFDGDGVLTLSSMLGSKDRARDVARQADGKLVVAADWYPGGPVGGLGGAAIMRFNVDGTLDTTFGSGGSVLLLNSIKLYSVDVLSDGKILAAGIQGTTAFVAVRLNSNGSFDTSYGKAGVAVQTPSQVTSFPPDDSMGVALQSDGKLVFAQRGLISGQPNSHLLLTRFTATGALDTTFGGGTGTTRLVLNGTTGSQARDVLVQSDGKIVVSGNAIVNGGQDMFAARFLSNGTLDTTFGTGSGVTLVDFGGADVAIRMALQSDGKIVLAGLAAGTFGGNTFGNGDFGLVRLTADGLLDTTFDGDGKAKLSLGADERIQALAIQADGRIAVGGYTSAGANDFAMARFLTDGSLDTSFDGDGVRKMPVGSDNDRIFGMLVDDLGRIVVVGTATDAVNGGDVAVGRFLADGSLDTSFSGSGISITGIGLGSARALASAEQPDGKIVVVGWLNDDSSFGNQRILWRLMPDGSLDPTFGTGGIVMEKRIPTNASDVFIEKDGKILVADALNNGLTRYNADGSRDAAFGTGGYVNLALLNLSATHAVLMDDGRIVVVGSRIFSTQDMTVGVFTADGQLDTTFDGDGKVTIDFDGGSENGRDVAVQADGKIVVAGVSTFGTTVSFAVARLNVDGSFDTTFATGGKGVYNLNGKGEGFSVLVQQDGKITVGGRVGTDIAMMRLLTDGTLDTSFGGDGFVVDPVTAGLDYMYDLLQESDGKLIGVGYKTPGTVSKVFVGRYLLDGTPDISFDGEDGVLLTQVGDLSTQGVTASLQSDGRLIVTGFTNRDANYDALILRYQMGVVAPAPNISTIDNVAARSGTAPPAIEFEVSHPVLDAAELSVSVTSGDTSILPNANLHPTYLGAGRWRIDVTPTRTAGTAMVTVVVSDGTVSTTETFNVTLVPPPTVVGVFASSSRWTGAFLSALRSQGLGDATSSVPGYRLSSGAGQLRSLPWSNVDTLTLQFDRDVNVTRYDLALVGTRGENNVPAITGFAWDADRFTATWTFAGPLAADKYLVQLNPAILDAEGAWLDGDWTTGATTSGDGLEGGGFQFRFNTLPGDVDGSASVAFGEIGQMRLKLGYTADTPGYDPRQDFDGSGSITFADVGQARLALGTSYLAFADPEPMVSTGGAISAGYSLLTMAPAAAAAPPMAAATDPAEAAAEALSGVVSSDATAVVTIDLAPTVVAEPDPSNAATVVSGEGFTYTSVSYGIASIGPASTYLGSISPGSIGPVSFHMRDLLRPTVERSMPVTFSPRFDRLATWSAAPPAIGGELDGIGTGVTEGVIAASVGPGPAAWHLNWRRLRRAAAPEPTATRVGAE